LVVNQFEILVRPLRVNFASPPRGFHVATSPLKSLPGDLTRLIDNGGMPGDNETPEITPGSSPSRGEYDIGDNCQDQEN
jgi:hypothetical protein